MRGKNGTRKNSGSFVCLFSMKEGFMNEMEGFNWFQFRFSVKYHWVDVVTDDDESKGGSLRILKSQMPVWVHKTIHFNCFLLVPPPKVTIYVKHD